MSRTALVRTNIFNDITELIKSGIVIQESKSLNNEFTLDGIKVIIRINQFVISKTINNTPVTYSISIPYVEYGGVELDMLTKMSDDSDIGLSNLINTLDDGTMTRSCDIDYRNKLLLTSYKSMNMINVMTDRTFIDNLSDNEKVAHLTKDKMFLYKVLSKAFINELIKYTSFNRIKNYSYFTSMKYDRFNMFNMFTYQSDTETFLHVSFNARGDEKVSDKYIRGYNFISTK